MTIKRKIFKYNNGRKEVYIDDSTEYHSFKEIKDFCYEDAKSTSLCEATRYTFVVIDSDEEIDVICCWVCDDFDDSDDSYHIHLQAYV